MSDSPDAASDDGDEEWAVSLADLEGGDEETYEPEPIEPGDPSLEGAAFVLLGVALTLVVLLGI